MREREREREREEVLVWFFLLYYQVAQGGRGASRRSFGGWGV